jgi:hypothetical protein
MRQACSAHISLLLGRKKFAVEIAPGSTLVFEAALLRYRSLRGVQRAGLRSSSDVRSNNHSSLRIERKSNGMNPEHSAATI